MNLHKDSEIYRDAIKATAQQKNIREIYIEKDYWVTYALHAIFHSNMKDLAVFKGGTSLSKCYQAINRFSEDIDIVVFQDEGLSNSQMDKRVRRVSKILDDTILEEVEVKDITKKRGQFRKVAYEYDKNGYRQDFGQVRDKIIVEVSRLGHFEPYEKIEVNSLINEMIESTGKDELIDKYGLQPFTLNVLRIERTFCEKIMSLVRFSYADDPYQELSMKIRHIYDLHMLLKKPKVQDFFKSNEFDKMLTKVGKDDIESYGDQYEWLYKHPVSALVFNEPQETWNVIRTVYNSTFKDLVIGDLPAEDNLISDLKSLSNRIEKISWTL